MSAFVGNAAGLVVLMGILFAWWEPVSSHLLHAASLALAAVALAVICVRARSFDVHWWVLLPLGAALLGLGQATLGWSVYPYETWNSVGAWLARAAVFWAAFVGFGTAARREALARGIVWCGAALSLLAVVQWYAGSDVIAAFLRVSIDTELSATFRNRDQFASLIALVLPIALAKALTASNRGLLPYAICSGMMYASVIASASRAGTILVTFESLVFLALAWRQGRRNLKTPALIAAALLVCTLVAGWETVWQRFHTSDPFAFRREMLISSIEMFRSRPLTGFGLGTWPSVYPAFAVFDPPGIYMNHAHNDWAEWASDGGVPQLILMAVLAAAAAWKIRRHPWALGILAVFLHALVDFPLQKSALACSLFFLLGVLAAAGSSRHSLATSAFSGRFATEQEKS